MLRTQLDALQTRGPVVLRASTPAGVTARSARAYTDGDVAELREVVTDHTDPERYAALGAAPSKAVLLLGPPGTGKMLLARAAAETTPGHTGPSGRGARDRRAAQRPVLAALLAGPA